jgi:hypothetical protein
LFNVDEFHCEQVLRALVRDGQLSPDAILFGRAFGLH